VVLANGPFTYAELGTFNQDQQNAFLQSIVESDPTNALCFDCLTPTPEWASGNHQPVSLLLFVLMRVTPVTHGAFICIRCSGTHRSLGVHLTFVQSVGLDKWKADNLMYMQLGGNDRARKFYESHGTHWKAFKPVDAK